MRGRIRVGEKLMTRTNSVLQVLFIGQAGVAALDMRNPTTIDDAWAECKRRGVQGFLSHRKEDCLGLFRGPESMVIGEIEGLLRRGFLRRIEVLDERLTQNNLSTADLLPRIAEILRPIQSPEEIADLEPYLEFGLSNQLSDRNRVH